MNSSSKVHIRVGIYKQTATRHVSKASRRALLDMHSRVEGAFLKQSPAVGQAAEGVNQLQVLSRGTDETAACR